MGEKRREGGREKRLLAGFTALAHIFYFIVYLIVSHYSRQPKGNSCDLTNCVSPVLNIGPNLIKLEGREEGRASFLPST